MFGRNIAWNSRNVELEDPDHSFHCAMPTSTMSTYYNSHNIPLSNHMVRAKSKEKILFSTHFFSAKGGYSRFEHASSLAARSLAQALNSVELC